MRFAYVWKGPNVPTVTQQRAILAGADRMVEEKRAGREERDLTASILRPGDQLCVATARCIADNVIDLHNVLAVIGEQQATLWVADLGMDFQGSKAMATITEDFQQTQRKERTKAAREKLKRLPKGKRGGRKKKDIPAEREDEFRELWSIKANSKRYVARKFDTTTKVVDRWAAERGLPEK